MPECGDATMRDDLPELLHDRLPAERAAAVRAHVARCARCAEELALLRRVRAALPVPAVNARAIAARVPAYRPRPAWHARPALRAAAAVVLLIGGAALAVSLGRAGGVRDDSLRVAAADSPAVIAVPASPALPVMTTAPDVRVADRPRESLAPAELPIGTLGELSERDLRRLLDELDAIEAVTPVEPEVVAPAVTRGGE